MFKQYFEQELGNLKIALSLLNNITETSIAIESLIDILVAKNIISKSEFNSKYNEKLHDKKYESNISTQEELKRQIEALNNIINLVGD